MYSSNANHATGITLYRDKNKSLYFVINHVKTIESVGFNNIYILWHLTRVLQNKPFLRKTVLFELHEK
jgi:hypothetical protein